MREFYVENDKKNNSITSYLKEIFPNLSNGVLFKALRNKDIRLNDVKISEDSTINYKDKLTVYISDDLLFNIPKELTILYEDENILAFFKPQSILSNNEDEPYNLKIGGLEKTFENIVQKKYPKAKICHRLDRNTCGILLFSKNDTAYLELLKGFKYGYILKEYIAYVNCSTFLKNNDLLEKYIVKDIKTGFVKIYDEKKKNSNKISTEYFVIKKDKILDYAILKVLIHTGKTHQIRAQLANIGHPIIGDLKYGKNEINKKFRIYKQLLFAKKYTFNFSETSPLYYLNKIIIQLDENIYTKIL